MDEFLSKISCMHFEEFHKRAMNDCHWSTQQWKTRKSGHTKLLHEEWLALKAIFDDMVAKYGSL